MSEGEKERGTKRTQEREILRKRERRSLGVNGGEIKELEGARERVGKRWCMRVPAASLDLKMCLMFQSVTPRHHRGPYPHPHPPHTHTVTPHITNTHLHPRKRPSSVAMVS